LGGGGGGDIWLVERKTGRPFSGGGKGKTEIFAKKKKGWENEKPKERKFCALTLSAKKNWPKYRTSTDK